MLGADFRWQGRLRYGHGLVKSVQKITNADPIVVVQLPPFRYRLVIDVGPIAAAHILDEEFPPDAQYTGVLAADRKIVGGQDDVAVRVPSEKNAILVESDVLLVVIMPFQNNQMSHVGTPRRVQGQRSKSCPASPRPRSLDNAANSNGP